MPIDIACPTCGHSLSAPADAAGQAVECPNCKAPLTLPAAAAPAPRMARRAVRKNSVADDRPRRSRRRFEDEDEIVHRPQQYSLILILILIAGVVGLGLAMLGVGLWLSGVFDEKKPNNVPQPAVGTPPQEFSFPPPPVPEPEPPKKPWTKGPPPPGWSFADGERFACFLPGNVRQHVKPPRMDSKRNAAPAQLKTRENSYEWWGSDFGDCKCEAYAYEYANRTIGTTQEKLFNEFKSIYRSGDMNAPWFEQHQQKFSELNGLPCLQVSYQDKLDWNGVRARLGNPITEAERKKQKYYAAIVLGKGSRLYVFTFVNTGKPLSDEDSQTILDSFEER